MFEWNNDLFAQNDYFIMQYINFFEKKKSCHSSDGFNPNKLYMPMGLYFLTKVCLTTSVIKSQLEHESGTSAGNSKFLVKIGYNSIN